MQDSAPFSIAVHDPKPDLRELHLSFTAEFQQMDTEQRLESMRGYVEQLLKQAQQMSDPGSQRGIMTVIEITEQLLPHIQANNLPLEQTLVVEMGEAAEGSSLDELLG